MSSPYEYLENLDALMPEIPEASIVSRSVYKDEQTNVTLFGFAAGEELTEHTASRPAILHFLKGEAVLTLGEAEMDAKAGSWVYMEPHLPHSIVARTPVVMLLTMLP